jgi:beta-1,4-N-acetylglucosaminyltransferase
MADFSRSEQQYCLVTVGATVGFKTLVDGVLHPTFWEFLRSKGFTNLRIQCGPDIPWASRKLSSLQGEIPEGFDVHVFELSRSLMKEEMILCQARQGVRSQGVIISHAGTGTILDAWKLGLPIVVVPNTDLLDDHQTEMARHLSKEGYAIMSTGNRQDLQEAIDKSDLLWEDNKARWPRHDPRAQENQRVSIWEVFPTEVQREEKAQMAND